MYQAITTRSHLVAAPMRSRTFAPSGRSLPTFFNLLGVVHDIDGMAPHTESDFLGVVRLEGNAGRLALPGWSRTLGVGQVVAVRLSQQLLQNRLPSAQLRHYCKQLLSVVGDPAVGDVIAVPATRRIEGSNSGNVIWVTRPVTRSTNNHPPRSQTQRGAEADSAGSVSLRRNTRRTTNKRSVTSCGAPVVYSFRRVSTKRARTFNSSDFPSAGPTYHLAEVHLPKAMTCGFGTAPAAPAQTRRPQRTRRGRNLLHMSPN
jgi:hypothetical protein